MGDRARSLYDEPRWYDLAFGWDPTVEVEFLLAAARRRGGRDPVRALEVACGTGRLLLPLARRGIRTTGLDRSAAMLRHLRAKASAEGLPVAAVQGDMEAPPLRGPFDLAFTVLDGLTCLPSREAVARHLRAMAGLLSPGGVYVVDLDVSAPAGTGAPDRMERWEMAGDGVRVEVEAGPVPSGTPGRKVERVRLRVTEGTGAFDILGDADKIALDPHDLRALLAGEPGLALAAIHASHAAGAPGAALAPGRRILVLERVARPAG